MSKEELNVYVVMHKEVDLSKYKLSSCYKRLMVGKKKSNIKDMLFDSVGENISDKNKNYCELTGLYWMWKHSKAKYVGLCHYRRFFVSNHSFKILNEKQILKTLSKYDIILPQRTKLDRTVYQRYKYGHHISDMDECKKVIKEFYPEYMKAFNTIMNDNKYYACNMFIMPKEKLDEYCEWLFKILFEVEKRIDISDRTDYQKRVYGFLSERLFSVWVEHQKFNIYENFIYNTEGDLKYKIRFAGFVVLRKLGLY